MVSRTLFATLIVVGCVCIWAMDVAPTFVVAALAGVSFFVVPRALLPALSILTFKGLGVAALSGPVAGPLYLTDVLLLVFVVRYSIKNLGAVALVRRESLIRISYPLTVGVLFTAWAFGVTVINGVSLTPLMRLCVYLSAAAIAASDARTMRLIGNSILFYALVELSLSLPAIPSRLVGATVGDPAQFGGLMMLAASVVFTKTWPIRIKAPVLLFLSVGLAFSQTRSVWFATLCCAAVIVFRKFFRNRYLCIIVPGVGVALGLWALPWVNQQFQLNAASGDYRANSFAIAFSDMQEYLFAGRGWAYASNLGNAGVSEEVSAYNLWLYIGSSVGLVGVLLGVLWLLGIVRRVDLSRIGQREMAITILVAMGMSEMPIYAGSLLTLILVNALGAVNVEVFSRGHGVAPDKGLRNWATSRDGIVHVA